MNLNYLLCLNICAQYSIEGQTKYRAQIIANHNSLKKTNFRHLRILSKSLTGITLIALNNSKKDQRES